MGVAYLVGIILVAVGAMLMGRAWSDWDYLVAEGKLKSEIQDLRERLGNVQTGTIQVAVQRDEMREQRDYARGVVAAMQRICEQAPQWSDDPNQESE